MLNISLGIDHRSPGFVEAGGIRGGVRYSRIIEESSAMLKPMVGSSRESGSADFTTPLLTDSCLMLPDSNTLAHSINPTDNRDSGSSFYLRICYLLPPTLQETLGIESS